MSDVVRLSKQEISFTAANTVYNGTVVRIFAPALSTITVRDSSNNIKGSMTIPANGIEYLKKDATDTISGTTTIQCTVGSY